MLGEVGVKGEELFPLSVEPFDRGIVGHEYSIPSGAYRFTQHRDHNAHHNKETLIPVSSLVILGPGNVLNTICKKHTQEIV